MHRVRMIALGMVGAKFLEQNGVAFLKKLLCLVVIGLVMVHQPDVVVAGGHIRMIRPQLLERDGQ